MSKSAAYWTPPWKEVEREVIEPAPGWIEPEAQEIRLFNWAFIGAGNEEPEVLAPAPGWIVEWDCLYTDEIQDIITTTFRHHAAALAANVISNNALLRRIKDVLKGLK
jgi:hypothetical protein